MWASDTRFRDTPRMSAGALRGLRAIARRPSRHAAGWAESKRCTTFSRRTASLQGAESTRATPLTCWRLADTQQVEPVAAKVCRSGQSIIIP